MGILGFIRFGQNKKEKLKYTVVVGAGGDEWCRSAGLFLQRSSTSWLCRSLCFQGQNYILTLLCFFFFFLHRLFSLSLSFPLQLQLLQIQKQYKLIKPGSSVLDLGCAPGAWLQVDISSIPSFELCERKLILDFYCYDSLQVACQSLGPLKSGGTVVGMDIKVRRSFI